MRKEWYIRIQEEPEGPYSVIDLRWDPRVNPHTLAWREGMSSWLPVKDIPELKDIFKDQSNKTGDKEGEELEGPERVLEMSPEPNYFYLIVLAIALLILLFLYFQYF